MLHVTVACVVGSRADAAIALRIAGFSLDDVLRARDQLALAILPPVTKRTLFTRS